MVNTTTGVRDRPAIISLVSYSYSTVDTEHVSGAERKESQSNLYLCIHRYRKWYWTLGFLEVRGRLLLNIMNNCASFVSRSLVDQFPCSIPYPRKWALSIHMIQGKWVYFPGNGTWKVSTFRDMVCGKWNLGLGGCQFMKKSEFEKFHARVPLSF